MTHSPVTTTPLLESKYGLECKGTPCLHEYLLLNDIRTYILLMCYQPDCDIYHCTHRQTDTYMYTQSATTQLHTYICTYVCTSLETATLTSMIRHVTNSIFKSQSHNTCTVCTVCHLFTNQTLAHTSSHRTELPSHLSDVKFRADVMTSSCVDTTTGIFRQPGDLRILMSSFMLSRRTLGGHMSILVTTTNTGTLSARAKPKCSGGHKERVRGRESGEGEGERERGRGRGVLVGDHCHISTAKHWLRIAPHTKIKYKCVYHK